MIDKLFESALHVVLQHEGGYIDNPDDPGGATKYGITQKSLNSCCASLDIPGKVENLTPADAAIYYKNEWWNKYNYSKIKSEKIARKLFDMAVNMGSYKANKIIQKPVITWDILCRLMAF